jgi:hypothetical protein
MRVEIFIFLDTQQNPGNLKSLFAALVGEFQLFAPTNTRFVFIYLLSSNNKVITVYCVSNE